MIVSDKWKDYEVIDTSDGEKLERWGKYILVRPDPQVIWGTPKNDKRWKSPNGHYYRSDKGGGHWEFNDLPEEWTISFGELNFNLKPFAFKHTGLFPEQAANWIYAADLIRKRKASGRETKVLNLFAYTGGATVSAANAGAFVTHVDASKGMVGWAKENAASSGIPHDSCRWIVDDCRKFSEREIRRGNKYDAIILDPPSYGRGPKGEIWKMEENIYGFLELVTGLLSDDPAFVILNSYTTGLQPAVLSYMMNCIIAKSFGGSVTADEVGLPVSSNGLILPCGATGRWSI
ncbi:MAG: class I SAM-dependent methyltransferase [Lachnospiraceae bacterium]|nr:class I SAM-dependent methyltransferase [Lachnospiraceae bacterium]